ncbi:MAG TPA: type II toxin-antitoxin system VapC family toxin [Chloroflexi bacterium]|nr:type II toxin-antitoxin system VapC family toxin [Chloroflexota bacterium]
MPTILVDTWAWLALNYKGDQDYQRAQMANRELLEQNYNYVTTNFVLDETYTLLRRRAYAQRSIEFGREIQQVISMGGLELLTITPDIEQDAWRIFEKYHDLSGLSYTDCTSFAVMHLLKIQEVFSNDKHFTVMGFTRRPF